MTKLWGCIWMVLDLIQRIIVAVELVTHYKLWQLTLTATSCLVAQSFNEESSYPMLMMIIMMRDYWHNNLYGIQMIMILMRECFHLDDVEENHDWILTSLLFRSNITGYYELISGDQGSDSTWVNLDFRLKIIFESRL